MNAIYYRLKLCSDAEPGTGFGTELMNDLIPRDERGWPVLPASHIKGLLREQWRRIVQKEWGLDEASLFGEPYKSVSEPSVVITRCHISDARLQQPIDETLAVARTAIDVETGSVAEQSLRITEAIPAGTEFYGKIIHAFAPDSREEIALRLLLLTLEAVGGNRSRGNGRCVINITDKDGKSKDEKISDLFARLASAPPTARRLAAPLPSAASSEAQLLRLDFMAEAPLLIPEWPEAFNHLASSWMVPASAVQGAIVTWVADRYGQKEADAIMAHPDFRAWPLLPVPADSDINFAMVAPLTLGMEKDEAKYCDHILSKDELLREKSARGILLGKSGRIFYLDPKKLPRIIRAHAGRIDADGMPTEASPLLFTTEALAPCQWTGLVNVPGRWAEAIKSMDFIAFGRQRSVQGWGGCRWQPADLYHPTEPFSVSHTPGEAMQLVALIAQSPWLCPEQDHRITPRDQAQNLIKAWLEAHNLQQALEPAMISVGNAPFPLIFASIATRFGWNRHAKIPTHPALVIQPGSVVFLRLKDEEKLTDELRDRLRRALLQGIGQGRERGFGAAACYPGVPTEEAAIFANASQPAAVASCDRQEKSAWLRWALDWENKIDLLPRPSQLGHLLDYVARGDLPGLKRYLQAQAQRPIYKDIYREITNSLAKRLDSCQWQADETEKREIARALRLLLDMRIAHGQGEERP